MPKNYLEQDFEEHIEKHLLASGYIKQPPKAYDRALCLIPEQVMAFIQASQPQEYEKLQKQYGADTAAKFCYRLSEEIRKRGTLAVLRQGLKDRGAKFRLVYFKPVSGLNPQHQQLYQQNQFSLIRQLKYSQKKENEIDLAFFLNGLPIITVELKNAPQTFADAVKQYKQERPPRGEPFLQFKRCLVHFAVGNEAAQMTTHLQGEQTRFFPFNRDTENPINPTGHKTAYLWEDIWQPDTLLDLIENYLHLQETTTKVYNPDKGLVEQTHISFIFPRFHQFEAVRKLLAAVRQEGVGQHYLIQHSAGSGKSNSIAWLAHQLASFYRHPSDTERLFDSIIVVTDRRVLDKQMQKTIKQFEQTSGVVVPIEHSARLRAALEAGKDIIITTLQKFPQIADQMAHLKGNRFAVIIDEAHSSQSGESAKHLKQTLSVNQLAQAEQEEAEADKADSLEDAVLQAIRSRGRQSHISYFAFTATPKNETLELFGRKNEAGQHRAFHLYTMRQAIEEGFIKDVLENYTTFERYFKLVKAIESDDEYEKRQAIRLLKDHVDLQPHAIEMKSKLMLDHFLDVTVKAIQGQGRAMVVTRSRLHALKFYLTFKRLMAERGLGYKPLVAFSGTVRDPDTGEDYTEARANGLSPKVSIPDALKTPDYQILIVANKFQTGFDEPLLHTMYVDKKLGGVNAVQTLSRLNRARRGKNETVVLDFANKAENIQKAFQPYYQTTLLEDETDPNKLYNLQYQLNTFEIYTETDIEDFAKVFFDPTVEAEKLQPILDRVVSIWGYEQAAERESFRATLHSFIRLYGFVSQLMTFEDTNLEKLYAFARNLSRKLPKGQKTLPYHIREAVNLDSFRIQQTYAGSLALEKKDVEIAGIATDMPRSLDDERDSLSNIIHILNETYGANFTEDDQVDMARIEVKLDEHEELQAVMNSDNSKENIRYKFDRVIDELFLEFVHNKLDLYKKLTDSKVNELLKERWFNQMYGESQGPGAGVGV